MKSKDKIKFHKNFDSDDSDSFERIGDLSSEESDDDDYDNLEGKDRFEKIDIGSIDEMEGVNPNESEDPFRLTAADEQLFKELKDAREEIENEGLLYEEDEFAQS